MKFKGKPKKEVFIGSFRCIIDEDTEKALEGDVLVKRTIFNGIVCLHYANGKIDSMTLGEYMHGLCDEIRGKQVIMNGST